MKQGRRARFVGRGRERALWLLGAAVLIAVLWAIAQQLKWPVWTQAVLAALAAAAALIIPELRARFGQDDTWAQLVEQRVKVSDGHGRLLRVRDIGLNELGVHAARVQVPYIKRDQQDKLEEAVGPGQAALVMGHSMAGKTRLAAEVVKQKFPDALLLFAESGKALRELLDGGLNPADYVVWLNELERFLGAGGLDENLLNRLTTGRAIVVATIRVEQWETYRPRDELRPPEWEVLQRFSEISLQRRLTGPELGRVRATVNDPGVLAAVDHYGLAEYLGAGPEALDKFEKGKIANPVGHALVRAAVDWRRTGLTRPVSEQALATMLPTYLADRPDVPRTNQAIDAGLAWATAKINETVALLGQVFTGSNRPVFEAFDYLVDQLTRTGTPVPDPMWTLALEQAESAELIVIGRTASRASKLATAETAWRRAADKGDSDVAPKAAFNLGALLAKQGDVAGAKAAYQQAIDSGHSKAAQRAASGLERLLRRTP
jgi:tetratricopeptide (TPR) repeat protein